MVFGEHRVETHARDTDLSMAYTIDPTVVDDYINSVEQMLVGDKYKVVGINLQYSAGRSGRSEGCRRPIVHAPSCPHLPLLHGHRALRPFQQVCQQH